MNENCKKCFVEKWFRNLPKPDCRIKYDIKHTDNPVTKSVYGDILKHREENDRQIECPFKG